MDEWKERCKRKEKDVLVFQTFNRHTRGGDADGIAMDIILVLDLRLLSAAVSLLRVVLLFITAAVPSTNTLSLPQVVKKSNSCCVAGPLQPTQSPVCPLQLYPTADWEKCGSISGHVCQQISFFFFFMNEYTCVGMCLG